MIGLMGEPLGLRDDTLSHNVSYNSSDKLAPIHFETNYTCNTVELLTQRSLKAALDNSIKLHYKH